MSEQVISIRSIQHYLYCPHRWGLLEIDCSWSENYFVTKANLMHDRVHSPDSNYTFRGKKHYTSVSVYNDEYNLYGVTDCIEISGDNLVSIVEYKPARPKNKEYNFDDLMQVFAQKLCVDNVFSCDSEGYLYYADVKKRIKLPLKENFDEYDALLRKTLNEMRSYLSRGEIPASVKDKRCNGCSMKDICIPSLKIKDSVKERIKETAVSEE